MDENMEWEQAGQGNGEAMPDDGIQLGAVLGDGMQPEGILAGATQPESAPSDGLPLEDLLMQVEQCIGRLENPQISLEDAFRYYEEGVRKLKACNEKVDQIEKKMLVINQHGELEEF